MNGRSSRVVQRLTQLISDYEDPWAQRGDHSWIMSWMTAAISILRLSYEMSPNSEILRGAVALCQAAYDNGPNDMFDRARSIRYLLSSAVSEIELGLVGSTERQVSAQTFDDLLDHAEAYLQDNRKEPAGVLTGVVFEDTTRKIGKLHEVENEKLDAVISGLASKNVFTGIEAKQARACAGLRTSATHASWEEFTVADVERAISFTKQIILTKLAG